MNHNRVIHYDNISSALSLFGKKQADILSPNELRIWLESHRDQITELALNQPLMAARHDDLGYGHDLVAGFLKRNWISYDKDDSDCEDQINVAAWDWVLCPIANRTL